MNSVEALRVLAKEMSARMQWYQEMGIDTWLDAPQEASVEASLEAPTGIQSESPGYSESVVVSKSPMTLEMIREELGDCQRCKLAPTRTQIVFGSGSPKAELLFIGEGPGREEDLQGEPFVGPAGQLLTKMIEAMGLSRETVYIANIIKCRPPQNRNPEADEIASCRPFLKKQIAVISPKIVCALGRFAAQTLMETDLRISALRGHFHEVKGLKILPTFHPAYLLRNPSQKRLVWQDLQKIMAELGLPLSKSAERRQ